MKLRSTLFALAIVAAGGCAGTTTQLEPVDPVLVEAEMARQRALSISTLADQQTRLERIAWPILRAAAPLCDVAPQYGLRVGTAHGYDETWLPAAREVFDISDTLTVLGTAPGSPADSAGLRVGDRIVWAAGLPGLARARAPEEFAELLRDRGVAGDRSLPLVIVRDGVEREIRLLAADVCPYGVAVVHDGSVNAFADGASIYVTTGMMRFAEDHELAVVVGHELAHNAMGHIDASNANALGAGFLGLLLDVAMLSQGVYTESSYMAEFAHLGAMTFSQDFEREADYVGLYAMALAGYPLAGAPTFWRHMAIEDPGSIELATSHPTTAERFVRLEQAIAEIERKRERGEPLLPEMEDRRADVR